MNALQGNCCILWIDIAWGLQKLGTILENKVCTSKSKHDIKAICIQPNVSCVMEFLLAGTKLTFIKTMNGLEGN